jgi:Peroxidase
MMDYFAKEFGFTSTEVVALMGVHTLGEARATNSGFQVRLSSLMGVVALRGVQTLVEARTTNSGFQVGLSSILGVVALLGVHTLGEARAASSGFQVRLFSLLGWWPSWESTLRVRLRPPILVSR